MDTVFNFIYLQNIYVLHFEISFTFCVAAIVLSYPCGKKKKINQSLLIHTQRGRGRPKNNGHQETNNIKCKIKTKFS